MTQNHNKRTEQDSLDIIWYQQNSMQIPYLEVQDNFAERSSHEPSLRHIPDDRRRETEEDHHKIGHGEIHDEVVGHSSHAVIPINCHANQRIAYQADEKDDSVKCDEDPLVSRGEYVILYHVEVVIVRYAVFIAAAVCRVLVVIKVIHGY